MIRYQRLIEGERHISSDTATALLVYAFGLSIALGIMLNVTGTVAGSLLVVLGVMLGIAMYLRFADALAPFFQQLELVSLEQPETRSQDSNHSERREGESDEGNTFELNEIAKGWKLENPCWVVRLQHPSPL